MARQTTSGDTRIQLLEEHLAHLERIIERQQRRINQLEQRATPPAPQAPARKDQQVAFDPKHPP